MTYLTVALGGALGSVLRFWLGGIAGRKLGRAFGNLLFWFGGKNEDAPWLGTLFVNVTGCFLIGLLGNLRENDPGDFNRYFLMIGVLGGYTTFSTFSLQTLELFQSGNLGLAATNVALSMALCLIGVWVGALAGRSLS